MVVPNPLGAKFLYFLGSILFGGLIVGLSTSTGVTPMTGGAIMLPEFNSNGTPSNTAKVAINEPVNAFLYGSGGNVKVSGGAKYAAICVPNPLTKLSPSQGSGAWSLLSFQMGRNPSNASFDITYEKSCNAGSGGYVIANNVQLSSGAVLTLSGSRIPPIWNGADYVKVSTLTTINSSTTARLRGFITDIFGE